MNIDQMIEAHEEVVAKLKLMKDNLLCSPDAVLTLRDVVAFMATLNTYTSIHLKVEIARVSGIELEWSVYNGKKTFTALTLADAFRLAFGDKTKSVDELVETLS